MMKIEKGYNFKIIALVVAVAFFLSNTAYGIDLKKPHLRTHISGSSEEGRDRLRDGLAAMLNLKGLTPKQHGLLNQALGTFFMGLNKVREDIHILTEDELAKIDPNSNLGELQGLKVYRYTREQLIKALKDIGASQKDIAYITANLVSHPGRFRDEKDIPKATNLFILDEHYRLLTQLNTELRIQWARHERAHLDNITRSEEEVQIDYPLKDVVEALKKKPGRFKDEVVNLETRVATKKAEDRQIKKAPYVIKDKLKNFGLGLIFGTMIFIGGDIDPAKFKDLAQQGNKIAVYNLRDLAVEGNSAAFNALKDVFNNTRELENHIYYEIADALLEVITSQDINIPQEIKSERLEAFKGDFKKVLSHIKFESGVNNPEVMKIVYKSIDLLGTELVRSVSSAIEKKFFRSPQRIGFYLCMPEVVAPLVEAYKEISRVNTDLSFSYFISAAFAEGYIKYAKNISWLGEERPFTIDGPMGLDRFGSVETSLKKKGFLPRDYEGFVRGENYYTNESGESYPNGKFKSPKDALIAHGALLLEDRARFLKDVQKLGYSIKILTQDEIGVGTYLYYSSMNPMRYVKKYGPNLIGKIKNGRHGQALFNAQWPQATSVLLDRAYSNVLKLSPATQGSPSKCLKTFYSEFKDEEVYIKDLIKRRIKSGGGYFEKTTVYTELKYLIKLNLVKRVKGKRGYYVTSIYTSRTRKCQDIANHRTCMFSL